MDIISYSIARKAINLTEGFASGVESVTVIGNSLHFVFKDGSTGDMTFDMAQGVSISNVSVNSEKHLICTLSDGNIIDAGEIPTEKGERGEQGIQGEQGIGIVDIEKTSSIGNTDIYEIKCSDGSSFQFSVTNGNSVEKVSELENDLNFITNFATNLVNYYTINDTYNKNEINDLVSTIKAGLEVEIVDELPSTDISIKTIYLIKIKEGLYNQYMYISNEWAMLGTSAIDLNNYYNISQINDLLNNYVSSLTFLNELSQYVKNDEIGKVAKTNSYNDLDDLPVVLSPDNFYVKEIIDEKLLEKVDKEEGKSLLSDSEIERLSNVDNYDDTNIKEDIVSLQTNKADKVDVYTKAETEEEIVNKIAEVIADAPEDFDTLKEISDWISGHEDSAAAMNSAIQDNKSNIESLQNSKVDKEDGKSLISDTEIERLSTLSNYDDTEIKYEISDLQNGKVDKEEGKTLILSSEVQRLASVESYDDTAIQSDISDIQSLIPAAASAENQLTDKAYVDGMQSGSPYIYMTQAEYEALTEYETDTLYWVTYPLSGQHLVWKNGECISNEGITVKSDDRVYVAIAYNPANNSSTSYFTSNLKKIDLANTVTRIENWAFRNCFSLTNITIPDSVTVIEENAFAYCKSLTNVTILDGVTSIKYQAFYDCASLTNITIPDSVTVIGGNVFIGCASLTEINVSSANEYYCSEDGILFSKDKTQLLKCPEGKTISSYIIPDSVTSIADCAFCNCTSLTSITIPDSVTVIGMCAFEECASLTSVTIPDSVTVIQGVSFGGCTALTSVNIGSGVTYILWSAFDDCTQSDLTITINQPQDSIEGSPWGATNATIVWTG